MHGSGLIFDAAAISGREVLPRIIRPANPLPGADFTARVPGGSVWWLQTARATFTTSAAVANRSPNIVYADSDAEFWRFPNAGVVAASSSLQYLLGEGLGFQLSLGGAANQTWAPLLTMPIPGGWSIGSVTSLIDVADQWSAIALYVLEVEETPYMVELARDIAGINSRRVDAIPDLAQRG